MKWLEIERSGPLEGTVRVQGSKNSSIALLAAACMSSGTIRLQGIPDIADIRLIEGIIREIGGRVERDGAGIMEIRPSGIRHANLNLEATSRYRASYYFVGALLSEFGTVTVGYPGGDDFGSRPIDQHVKALQAMGATFTFDKDHYMVRASRLTGADIYFDTITSGATINAMLAAVKAEGTTILRNAARDPEVVDTANLLNAMGAHIVGAGTDTIRIKGVRQLSRDCTYTVIPDRLIACSYLIAAGVTGGCITVEDVIPDHMESCLVKLREIGLDLDITDSTVTASRPGRLRATRIRAGMYPVFATDLQQPITALLLQAPGRSIVTDRVYPGRIGHVPQLRRMGAEIDVKNGSIFIQGAVPLRGEYVHATDVRAGTCLLLAGLSAEGITRISGVEHIERGNENIVAHFRQLGAKIVLKEGDGEEEFQRSIASPR